MSEWQQLPRELRAQRKVEVTHDGNQRYND